MSKRAYEAPKLTALGRVDLARACPECKHAMHSFHCVAEMPALEDGTARYCGCARFATREEMTGQK